MENSNPFTNKIPQPSTTDRSPEDIMLYLGNLRLTADGDDNDYQAESWMRSNKNPDHNDDDDQFEMQPIVHQMIESVLDEGNSSSTAEPSNNYQPHQSFEINFRHLWRSSDHFHVMVNQSISNPTLNPNVPAPPLPNNLSLYQQQIKDKILGGDSTRMFDVMTDKYESKVFEKIIECCDQSQLKLILTNITSQPQAFIETLLYEHGVKSANRLIKVLKKASIVSEFISVLVSNFVPLMTTNKKTSSVIINCFDWLNARQNQKLYEELIKNCLQLAKDGVGYLALNSSINLVKGPHRDQLLDVISSHAIFLSQDPFGNFVVQTVLDLENPFVTTKICSTLRGKYVDLSMHKCASHVVEKCLTTLGINYVLSDLVDCHKLWKLASDPFGNYVLQKAISRAESVRSPYYRILVEKLYEVKERFVTCHFAWKLYLMVITRI